MRRALELLAWAVLAGGAAAAAAATSVAQKSAAAAQAGSAAPAQWRSWDLLVNLQDLPKAYTCDDLWYRFHDLLQALGARPDMQILTYHCGNAPAQAGRSASVQLQFALPDALAPSQARYADLSAVRATVRIAPGEPHSFTADDCELLRQIDSLLLPALPLHVVAASFSCSAPQGAARERFALRVQALLPHS